MKPDKVLLTTAKTIVALVLVLCFVNVKVSCDENLDKNTHILKKN